MCDLGLRQFLLLMSLLVPIGCNPAEGRLAGAGGATGGGTGGGGAGGALGPCGSTDTSPRSLRSWSVTCTDGVSHVVTEFGFPAGSAPGIITAGPDGNLWFTERAVTGPTGHQWYGGSNIGRITPEGSITEFVTHSVVSDLTTGPDGNLWYTDFSEVARLSPSGELTKFPLPDGVRGPASIVTGPDSALWFTESMGIGRVSLEGAITTFQLPISPDNLHPIIAGSLVSANDGNLWFTEDNGIGIGRMSRDGTFTDFALPTADAIPSGLVLGPEGGLWFSEGLTNRGAAPGNSTIGRVDYSGVITESTIPVTTNGGVSLLAGPDGNLWFKGEGDDYNYTLIGRVSPTGEITVCPRIAGYSVSSIVFGPDGNLWFMDAGPGCSIDRLSL